MRIQDVAKAYQAEGWAIVPLVQGAKKADTKWRTRLYTDADFQDDSNIAVKLGEDSGWLVDVDCDTPLAMSCAKLLLPNTGRVFGRSGKPESHYLFICKDAKTTQFTDGSKMIVELRSTGGYTMFPPSMHPSGEPVEWNLERDVMTLDVDTLMAVVREVALTALIAEHWGELDHASMGHLTGFWLQSGLDAATVKRLLKVVCSVCDKTTVDEVLKLAEATIAKHAAGERITGGPKLKEALGEKLVNRMRSWLRVADVDAIDEMNERHFWVRMGKDDVVGREDDDYPVFQRPKSLYTEYANRQIMVGMDDKGKPQMKPLFPRGSSRPTAARTARSSSPRRP
jgi:putative DNA primase/helicase